MQYYFDEVIDRKKTNSLKWDAVTRIYGDPEVLPMWVADMDFLPPEPIVEAVALRAARGHFGYSLRPDSLSESIVGWLARRHNWQVEREWLTYTSGVVPALALAVQAYSQPGDKIIIQPPVYHPFFAVIQNNGRQVVNNPLKLEDGRYSMDFDGLEKCFDSRVKMLILCSPHNPVGRVWTREELTRLGEICLRKGIVIVSDEIHFDLILGSDDAPIRHYPLASLSEELAQNTVTCFAPSKTFNIAGFHSSAVITPNARLRALFDNSLESSASGGSNLLAALAWEAACRESEGWLDALLDYLRGNLSFLCRYFEERIPRIKVIRPEGTYLVWLDFRGLELSQTELKTFLATEAKVGLNDGAAFGPGGEGFQRMNIACPRSTLEEGLRRIEAAVGRMAS